jgi:hypothetical protein
VIVKQNCKKNNIQENKIEERKQKNVAAYLEHLAVVAPRITMLTILPRQWQKQLQPLVKFLHLETLKLSNSDAFFIGLIETVNVRIQLRDDLNRIFSTLKTNGRLTQILHTNVEEIPYDGIPLSCYEGLHVDVLRISNDPEAIASLKKVKSVDMIFVMCWSSEHDTDVVTKQAIFSELMQAVGNTQQLKRLELSFKGYQLPADLSSSVLELLRPSAAATLHHLKIDGTFELHGDQGLVMMDDFDLRTLGTVCINLKRLELDTITKLTGKGFDVWHTNKHKLQVLKLSWCLSLEDEGLQQIVQLSHLDILCITAQRTQLTKAAFSQIDQYQHKRFGIFVFEQQEDNDCEVDAIHKIKADLCYMTTKDLYRNFALNLLARIQQEQNTLEPEKAKPTNLYLNVGKIVALKDLRILSYIRKTHYQSDHYKFQIGCNIEIGPIIYDEDMEDKKENIITRNFPWHYLNGLQLWSFGLRKCPVSIMEIEQELLIKHPEISCIDVHLDSALSSNVIETLKRILEAHEQQILEKQQQTPRRQQKKSEEQHVIDRFTRHLSTNLYLLTLYQVQFVILDLHNVLSRLFTLPVDTIKLELDCRNFSFQDIDQKLQDWMSFFIDHQLANQTKKRQARHRPRVYSFVLHLFFSKAHSAVVTTEECRLLQVAFEAFLAKLVDCIGTLSLSTSEDWKDTPF